MQPLPRLCTHRSNLDYLVDEVCAILKCIRQANSSDQRLSSSSPSHDDRIIRVVGAVFFEIQQTQSPGDGAAGGDVTMLLRDLIRESLDVIDVLCVSSTSYAETTREEEGAQAPHLSYQPSSSLRHRHGQASVHLMTD
jgi:hypothetical protein